MKKLTTKLTIAAATLVVVAGAAWTQTRSTLMAVIPFEFRAGGKVMAAGTYRVEASQVSGTPIYQLSNVHARKSILLVPQAPVDPTTAWKAEGNPKLAFACTGGSCALAEIWDGSGNFAYTFHRPGRGGDEDASLRVIPMQREKGE
ncbi:MAG TPA: hypothetical protein VKF41_04780 [Bryobacteraceae bacterium]|nr:hypothetical protein [Bryobacteraceae bacterium]